MTTNIEHTVTNPMLNLEHSAGQEIQSGVSCVAYAIDGEHLVFAAFFGAETGIDAVQALSWTKGWLHFSDARVKAKTPIGTFGWHKGIVPSLNKACTYFMSKSAEMVFSHDNKTFVMDMNANHNAPISPETIQLIGQRVGEICNVSVLSEWFPELIKAAREYPNLRSPLVHMIKCENCRVWAVVNDGDTWATLVQKLLKENKLIITRNAK